jgi:hypothetical protein
VRAEVLAVSVVLCRTDRSVGGQGPSQVGLHPNDESELPAPLNEQRRPIGGGRLTKTTSDLHLGHKLPPSPASIAFSCQTSSSSSKKAISPIALIKNQSTSVVLSNQPKWSKQVRELQTPYIYIYIYIHPRDPAGCQAVWRLKEGVHPAHPGHLDGPRETCSSTLMATPLPCSHRPIHHP